MSKVIVIPTTQDQYIKPLNVCAYARVSSGKDAMLHSLSAQISYYQTYIQARKNWRFCGVYADEAITGTKANREQFQAMLAECRKGNIDVIITKSITRFARNTITLLQTVRELKDLGINVYFEEQNINTLSSDGEVLLTLLASYAQEESRSASENQKWRVKVNFEEGKPWNYKMYGYRYKDGKLGIDEHEADIVRWIFNSYLNGKGATKIANELAAQGETGRHGSLFCRCSVMKILTNYAYTGNLILQTTFRENYLTKAKKKNEGQLPMYHAENTHEAIISLETFKKVQSEISKRREKFGTEKKNGSFPFSRLIKCENCGQSYVRKTVAKGKAVWICKTYNIRGKAYCSSKQIPETILEEITTDLDLSKIKQIIAANGNKLTFVFKDGHEEIRYWKDRSRSKSWTNEMRQQARECAFRGLNKCQK